MTVQNKGWIEGWSNGEALSRHLAQILYPNCAWLFSTGNAWLNGGRPVLSLHQQRALEGAVHVWCCFGEYCADSEQQVETVVWETEQQSPH